MKIYTGVGSRDIPKDIHLLMENIGEAMAKLGWTLRSGGADGSDSAFEDGCDSVCGEKEIYIPWDGFNNRDGLEEGVCLVEDKDILKQAKKLAKGIHPAWESCSKGAKELHTRNVFQVLGDRLDKPSKFLICYAKVRNGLVQGGTATAYNLALQNGIECFNLFNLEHRQRVERWLGQMK